MAPKIERYMTQTVDPESSAFPYDAETGVKGMTLRTYMTIELTKAFLVGKDPLAVSESQRYAASRQGKLQANDLIEELNR
jgi:hypothetical protein